MAGSATAPGLVRNASIVGEWYSGMTYARVACPSGQRQPCCGGAIRAKSPTKNGLIRRSITRTEVNMSSQAPYSVQRLADRMAIQDLMYRWCRSVDRLDFDGIRKVFHPDAVDRHGPFNGGVEALIDWIRERHKTIPFSMHQISNMLIEFASDDLALVETYVRTVQRYPAEAKASLAQLSGGRAGSAGSGADLFTCSRYVDRIERRGGEWRIALRTLVQDWKQIVDVDPDAPVPQAGWIVGRRDADDPVFEERRALGIQ
jgi:hypothetical protein